MGVDTLKEIRKYWKFISLLLVTYLAVYGHLVYAPRAFALDFVAVYCVGQVSNAGADPYRTEPLRTCEDSESADLRSYRGLVLPAPFPSYDIAIARIIALVPFRVAVVLWTILLLTCSIAIMALTVEVTGLDLLIPVSALSVFLFAEEIFLGQIVTFTILGVLLACRGVRSKNSACLGAGIGLACVEPHVGLPSIVCVLVFGSPRDRLVVAGALSAVAVIALVAQPFVTIAEYFRLVLPAHASSEIEFHEQYGLAFILHTFGIETESAIRLSGWIYVTAVALGLMLAGRWWRAGSFEVAICGIGAMTLIATPFLHITQIAFAIPAALMLYAKHPRRLSGTAVIMLAFPWTAFAIVFALAPLVIAACSYLANKLLKARPLAAVLAATVVIVTLTLAGLVVADTSSKRAIASSAAPSSLAEVSWQELVNVDVGPLNVVYWIGKFPTFAGLAIVSVLFAFPRIARGRPVGANAATL